MQSRILEGAENMLKVTLTVSACFRVFVPPCQNIVI